MYFHHKKLPIFSLAALTVVGNQTFIHNLHKGMCSIIQRGNFPQYWRNILSMFLPDPNGVFDGYGVCLARRLHAKPSYKTDGT